ncbi:ribonuclease III [Cesiribacter andamanensis]|uniref:Ribonuclease 3 n=1 Tax=Cesiribacter andamanensis AMV16 TaxID=1279009 RepID=M7N738_9BACT|nr:ribonuclease III [Cesiribacter andamanensis]EMR03051.1 Ribonuclease 3 [Cesiribacter andamanensis AMV16]
MFSWALRFGSPDRKLAEAMHVITGRYPGNLHLYKLAMLHSSAAPALDNGHRASNERLEYLGDAVLNAVVADYLFSKFPFKDEGFLTEMRSRIVNRESLNDIGRQLGLNALLVFDNNLRRESYRTIFGNALEALIGAIYLDWGYAFCAAFIENRLLLPYFHLDTLINTPHNHKSLLIEWAQKEARQLQFEVQDGASGQGREFTATILLNGEPLATGKGSSKKKAEKDAARKAWSALGFEP